MYEPKRVHLHPDSLSPVVDNGTPTNLYRVTTDITSEAQVGYVREDLYDQLRAEVGRLRGLISEAASELDILYHGWPDDEDDCGVVCDEERNTDLLNNLRAAITPVETDECTWTRTKRNEAEWWYVTDCGGTHLHPYAKGMPCTCGKKIKVVNPNTLTETESPEQEVQEECVCKCTGVRGYTGGHCELCGGLMPSLTTKQGEG